MKIGPTYPEKQKKAKVKRCLLALYPDTEVILTAVRDNIDLIICYTALGIWKFNQITDELYEKMQILLENRIHLYIIPEEWNYVKSGLIEIISDVLNLTITNLLRVKIDHQYKIIGRICQITTPSKKLIDLLTLIKNKLNISSLRYLGDLDSSVQKIAINIGYPLTPKILKLAKRVNIDTIICENITYGIEKLAEELDIKIIDTTLYIVNLGLLKLSQALRMEYPRAEIIFINLKPSIQTF